MFRYRIKDEVRKLLFYWIGRDSLAFINMKRRNTDDEDQHGHHVCGGGGPAGYLSVPRSRSPGRGTLMPVREEGAVEEVQELRGRSVGGAGRRDLSWRRRGGAEWRCWGEGGGWGVWTGRGP